MSNELVINGLDEAIANLGQFTEELDKYVFDGVKLGLSFIENDMQNRVASRFNKYAEGVLQASISHTLTMNDDGVFGSVGIYHMPNKTSSGNRRLTSPIVAYFLNYGVQPHSLQSGDRAPRLGTRSDIVTDFNTRKKNENPDLWHPGIRATNFLNDAVELNGGKVIEFTMQTIDKKAERL